MYPTAGRCHRTWCSYSLIIFSNHRMLHHWPLQSFKCACIHVSVTLWHIHTYSTNPCWKCTLDINGRIELILVAAHIRTVGWHVQERQCCMCGKSQAIFSGGYRHNLILQWASVSKQSPLRSAVSLLMVAARAVIFHGLYSPGQRCSLWILAHYDFRTYQFILSSSLSLICDGADLFLPSLIACWHL